MLMAPNHKTTLFITLGGALTGLGNALQAHDLLRSCYLAAMGTVVSFVVTLVLKRVFKRWM